MGKGLPVVTQGNNRFVFSWDVAGEGSYVVVSTDKAAPELDLKEEVMDTLLSYLEVRHALTGAALHGWEGLKLPGACYGVG